MTFQHPGRFVLLVGVIALAVVFIVLQFRRRQYAVRLASAELLNSIAPNRPGLRRYVPAVLFLLGLTITVVAFADPVREEEVASERSVLVLAIDVSYSMDADDVAPTRLDAAKEAAIRFVEELPNGVDVSLVSFSGVTKVEVSPTDNTAEVTRAIDRLETGPATAIGEAIFTSLDLVESFRTDDGSNSNGEPSTDGPPPGVIVVLSDGETTAGRPDSEAIAAASDAGIAVSTISVGTLDGVIVYDDPYTSTVEEDVQPVPVVEEALQAIADGTGGTYSKADSLDDLDQIYADIGEGYTTEIQVVHIAARFVGVALLFYFLAAAASLLWFQRLP